MQTVYLLVPLVCDRPFRAAIRQGNEVSSGPATAAGIKVHGWPIVRVNGLADAHFVNDCSLVDECRTNPLCD